MKNKQAKSDRFIQALESDNADALSFEEQQVHKFGQDLRALADQDLPESNEVLREQLTTKLAEQEPATAVSKDAPSKPVKSQNRLGWKLALAGCVLLTISVAAMMMPRSEDVYHLVSNGPKLEQPETTTDVERNVSALPSNSIALKYDEDADVTDDGSTSWPDKQAASIPGGPATQAGQDSQQQQTNLQGQPLPTPNPGDDDLTRKYVADTSVTKPASRPKSESYRLGETTANPEKTVERVGLAFNESIEGKDEKSVKFNSQSGFEIAEQEKLAKLALVESMNRSLSKIRADSGRDELQFGAMGGGGGGGTGGGRGGAMYGGRGPATTPPPSTAEYFGDSAGGIAGLVVPPTTKLGRAGESTTELRASGAIGGRGEEHRDGKNWHYYRYRRPHRYETSGEQYEPIVENSFYKVDRDHAKSTFSIDVDTASYSNMRRFLQSGQRPPRNAVRIEELVNYFDYDYPQPKGDRPFAVDMEIASCPWNQKHHLLRIALKGKEIHRSERAATNLVFLLDVSGSMQDRNKLPLLKQGLMMMVQQLTENDSVSIVTYAGNAGVVLEPTNGENKRQIEKAIERLNAGGSTNGSAGIEMAYELAQKQFINGGSNRVILATDGDLNVGITDDNSLVELIKRKASEGVFLTVLGFGTGNLKDGKLEKLADNGNGMYAYIDNFRESHKVLIEQMSGSLETIAKDVKIQIEFNPGEVRSYRLIGYENRVMAAQDFKNDKKDAGDIGAGHTVTALYELELTGGAQPTAAVEGLKYQQNVEPEVPEVKKTDGEYAGELLTLALRYKKPDAQESEEIDFVLKDEPMSFSSASSEFRFAAAVASFGMMLRGSQHQGETSLRWVEETASRSCGEDVGGYRAEFIDLVRRAGGTR